MTDNSGMINGFHHVAMTVKSFEASVKFYKEGLGLKELMAWGEGDKRAIMLDAGRDNYIEIFAGGSGDKPEGIWQHLAFSTVNCDAALEKARNAGAIVTVEPKDVDVPAYSGVKAIRIAFCKGPDGETIEFFQYR